MDYTSHYESPLGGITMAAHEGTLVGLWFDGQQHFASTLSTSHEERSHLPLFNTARGWLDEYFSGHIPTSTPPLLLRGTEFQQRVWQLLLSIPYGETSSYGILSRTLATQMGCEHLSAQAVGQAVGRNPIALIVPCHRVVAADGSPSGYAGGIDKKQYLLQLEARHR